MFDHIKQHFDEYDDPGLALEMADGYHESIEHNRTIMQCKSDVLRAGVVSLGIEVFLLAVLGIICCF